MQTPNIVIIGMPGSGKTTISTRLGKVLSRPVADCDVAVTKAAGKPIPQIFAEDGEERFRRLETEALAILGRNEGTILSTGGGCVTRAENYPLLRQNGVIFWLCRDLEKLPMDDRPLSKARGVATLAKEREPLYRTFADYIIDNNGSIEETVRQILEALENTERLQK